MATVNDIAIVQIEGSDISYVEGAEIVVLVEGILPIDVIAVDTPGSPHILEIVTQGPQGIPGEKGEPGADSTVPGPPGPANTLTVGTVTTGAAGTNASVSISGTSPNQSLSFTIPRGNTGATGAKGDTGAPGPANTLSIGTVTTGAAGSSAASTITGTSPNQILNLTIPRGDTGAQGIQGIQGIQGVKGDKGDTGLPGPANTLSIGTVTTGAAGSNAASTITGTSPNQILNLTIPRGDTGAQGLKGDKGDKGDAGVAGPANTLTIGTVTTGAAGSSASSTITGTSPNQILNLTIPRGDQGIQGIQGVQGVKGDKGDTGATGSPGPANTLAIGTVTTGAAGSNASATITGTSPSQTLNMTIPRGNTGATGPAGLVWRGAWASATAYAVNDAVTYNNSSYRRKVAGTTATNPAADTTNWELIAAQGATGNTGPTGPANTLSIGTVTTGNPGGEAAASITGTAPNQTLNLTLPLADPNVISNHRILVRRTANQSIAQGTPTPIVWQAADYDPMGMWTTTNGLQNIVVPVAGVYAITSSVHWQNPATVCTRSHLILIDGLAYAGGEAAFESTGVRNELSNASAAITLHLAAGSNIRVDVFHQDSAAINIEPTQESTRPGTFLIVQRLA